MAIVTGIFTIGASVTFVATHTLGVERFGPQGNVLSIRLVLFCEGTGRNIIVTAQTRFFTGKILLVFSPELSVKRNRVAVATSNGSFLPDVVMVTIRAFVTILIGMGKMGKDNPAAAVVQHDTGRVLLHSGREKETGCSRNG